MWLSSSTRKPVSGRRPVPPVAAPSVICDIFLHVVMTSVRPVARWLTVARDARQAAALGSSLPCLLHPRLERPAGAVELLQVDRAPDQLVPPQRRPAQRP